MERAGNRFNINKLPALVLVAGSIAITGCEVSAPVDKVEGGLQTQLEDVPVEEYQNK